MVLVRTADRKLLRVLIYDVRPLHGYVIRIALMTAYHKVVPEIGTSVDVIGVIHTLEEMQAWEFCN